MADEEEVDMFGRTIHRSRSRSPSIERLDNDDSDRRRRRGDSRSPEADAHRRRRSRSRSASPAGRHADRRRSRSRDRPYFEDRGRTSTGSVRDRPLRRFDRGDRFDNRRRRSDNFHPSPHGFPAAMAGPLSMSMPPMSIAPPLHAFHRPSHMHPHQPPPPSLLPTPALKRKFFDHHKGDEWFREQYGWKTKEELVKLETLRAVRRQQFESDFAAGHIYHLHFDDDIDCDGDEETVSAVNASKNPLNAEYVDNTVIIAMVLLKFPRLQILALFEPLPNYRLLTFTPVTSKSGFHTMGHILFATPEACVEAVSKLNRTVIDGFELRLRGNNKVVTKREAPALTREAPRVLRDIEVAMKLIRHFDSKKFATATEDQAHTDNTNILLDRTESLAGLTPIQRLNRLIAYLRYVHCYCYYCAQSFATIEQLYHQCGMVHTRASQASVGDSATLAKMDSGNDATLSSSLDAPANPILQSLLDSFYASSISHRGESKYACELCPNKMFRGEEFVRKHLQNKHSSVLAEIEAKANDEWMWEQYLQDAHAYYGDEQGNIRQPQPQALQPVISLPMINMALPNQPPPPPIVGAGELRGLRSYADLDTPDTAPVIPDYGLLLTTPQQAKKHYGEMAASVGKWQPKAKKAKAASATTTNGSNGTNVNTVGDSASANANGGASASAAVKTES